MPSYLCIASWSPTAGAFSRSSSLGGSCPVNAVEGSTRGPSTETDRTQSAAEKS